MKLDNQTQVFNLFNTNGRRKDIINAYTVYMEILNDLIEEDPTLTFNSYPESWGQYRFYEEAIKRSPEVFKKHANYDWFVSMLENKLYLNAFESRDLENIYPLKDGNKMLQELDKSIEARSRHYTSNLVKIGFVDQQRIMTPVGKSFVMGDTINRGEIESLLPIDDINLIFLRQLLKLRIYSYDCSMYYSPMMLCMYILLHFEKINISDFRTAIAMINPYYAIDINELVSSIKNGCMDQFEANYIDFNFGSAYDFVMKSNVIMEQNQFEEIFTNRKSSEVSLEYYNFYRAFMVFITNRNSKNLSSLREAYIKSKSKINKAFSYGRDIFKFDKNDRSNVDKFSELNKMSPLLNTEHYNLTFYTEFHNSKRHDSIHEYGDTLMRLLSATGVVSMKNGIVTLKYKEIFERLFSKFPIADSVFVKSTSESYEKYENDISSPLINNYSIEKILLMSKTIVINVVNAIRTDLNVTTIEEVKRLFVSKVNTDFIEYINQTFPRERLIKILGLFSDRANDELIKKEVNSTASVPTIYEYIIGIAWYHISNKQYDVFSSFNLTMNADFIPETHAGGGNGDIVAQYEDKVIMLEATLMNKQAQKRGEWEPVLRHATNLTIEEHPKKVFTLFIADELDDNTINIWRAVASVPLKSSQEIKTDGAYAENVMIMPLQNNELSSIIAKEIGEEILLSKIEDSFYSPKNNFDLRWRDNIIKKLI